MEVLIVWWVLTAVISVLGFSLYLKLEKKRLGDDYLWSRGDLILVVLIYMIALTPILNVFVLVPSISTLWAHRPRKGQFAAKVERWWNAPVVKRKDTDAK